MTSTKNESMKLSFIDKKPYNKTVIDFNFGRHEDLSTLKSGIHFFGYINPQVYLIEVINCIILGLLERQQSEKGQCLGCECDNCLIKVST